MNKDWFKYSAILPPVGEEVIAFSHRWINVDFNPKGIRIGFRTEEDNFVSAYWWDYQDDYTAISKLKCESNPDFYVDHLGKTEPEWWRPIPNFEE